MTLTDLAKELKVSRQTVYNRCKSQGVNFDSLTATDTSGKRQLTREGEKLLRQILTSKIDVSNVKEKRVKVDVKLTALENRIRELEKERDFLQEQIREKDQQIRAAQITAVQAQQTAAALADQLNNKGLFSWIKRRRLTAPAQNTGNKVE